jgi:cell filamentation protein
MVLANKLNITNQVELNKAEEKISKQKAKQLFESGDISQIEVGTFKGLAQIHSFLFGDIYEFSGKLRDVNIAKGNFRFAPLMYLVQSLEHIDNTKKVSGHDTRHLNRVKESNSTPFLIPSNSMELAYRP